MSILFVRNQMVRVLHSLFPPPWMLTQCLGYLVPSNGSVIVKHLERLVQRKSTRWAPLVGRMIRLQTDMGVWSQNRVTFLRFNHHLSILLCSLFFCTIWARFFTFSTESVISGRSIAGFPGLLAIFSPEVSFHEFDNLTFTNIIDFLVKST